MSKGQHTMHHIPGVFNSIWSDMAIETTFMRYGHSRQGIIGVTLKPEAVTDTACILVILLWTIWMLCAATNRHRSKTHTKRKLQEEWSSIRQTEKNLCDKLELCIDPLDTTKLSDGLVNVVTGQITNYAIVNPDKAIQLGKEQWDKFEQSWLEGFYRSIPKVVHIMATTRKHVKVGKHNIINTEAIYARAMSLHNTSRDMDPTTLMSYELSPVPTAFIDDHGDMRLTSSKSTLKNAFKVKTAQRTQPGPIDLIVLDGCAVLWIIPWPPTGSSVQEFLHKRLLQADVFLVFDRYVQSSTKDATRASRENKSSRVYTWRAQHVYQQSQLFWLCLRTRPNWLTLL